MENQQTSGLQDKLNAVRAKLAKVASNRNKIPIAQAYQKILEFTRENTGIQENDTWIA